MKKDNKGFSLVELIVVVAIMAVLMTVLAPQLLTYVEKTRIQKDNSAIAEIANAVKIAMADETINSKIPEGTTINFTNSAGSAATIKFKDANVVKAPATPPAGTDVSVLANELHTIIGETYTTTSNTYKTSGTAIVLTVKTTGGVKVEVTGYIETANGTTTISKTF